MGPSAAERSENAVLMPMCPRASKQRPLGVVAMNEGLASASASTGRPSSPSSTPPAAPPGDPGDPGRALAPSEPRIFLTTFSSGLM